MSNRADVNVRAIAKTAAAMALSAVVMHASLLLVMARWARQRDYERKAPGQGAPSISRLEIDGGELSRQINARALDDLMHYGWIGRPGERARIPIERAIELTAKRGLPARGSR